MGKEDPVKELYRTCRALIEEKTAAAKNQTEAFLKTGSPDRCRSIIADADAIYHARWSMATIKRAPALDQKYWDGTDTREAVEELAFEARNNYLRLWIQEYDRFKWGMESSWLQEAIDKGEETLREWIWDAQHRKERREFIRKHT